MRNLLALALGLILIALQAGAAPCDVSPSPQFQNYRDFGVTVEYPPSVFTQAGSLDHGRKFTSRDNMCRFFVTTGENQLGAGAREFENLSEQYYTNKGISVTYRSKTDRWYVVSGLNGNEIFYEKGVLSRDGKNILVMLLQYPKAIKRDFDPIVSRMSHSFWVN